MPPPQHSTIHQREPQSAVVRNHFARGSGRNEGELPRYPLSPASRENASWVRLWIIPDCDSNHYIHAYIVHVSVTKQHEAAHEDWGKRTHKDHAHQPI